MLVWVPPLNTINRGCIPKRRLCTKAWWGIRALGLSSKDRGQVSKVPMEDSNSGEPGRKWLVVVNIFLFFFGCCNGYSPSCETRDLTLLLSIHWSILFLPCYLLLVLVPTLFLSFIFFCLLVLLHMLPIPFLNLQSLWLYCLSLVLTLSHTGRHNILNNCLFILHFAGPEQLDVKLVPNAVRVAVDYECPYNCPDLCKRVREHDAESWPFVLCALAENFGYVLARQSRRKVLNFFENSCRQFWRRRLDVLIILTQRIHQERSIIS